MADLREQQLANCIEESVRPLSFKRFDPSFAIDAVNLVAVWKYKTLNMNRGIALVTLGYTSLEPGETASAIKKPIGKAIGYIPFVYELGLQLVLLGRGILASGANLERSLDKVNTQTVILQSIHLVDIDATSLIQDHSVPVAGAG